MTEQTEASASPGRIAIPRRESVRVLFAFGVLPPFYEEDDEGIRAVHAAMAEAYADLRGRYGAEVLGTFDDYELNVGPSSTWPWTSFILADLPDVETAMALCNVIRTSRLPNGHRLWRYIKVEARIGTALAFGND